jgi:hypothetical protein
MKRAQKPVSSNPRKELVQAAWRGGVTLVLGAGISVSRGLPTWDTLAQDLWREAFGPRRSPWDTRSGGKSPRDVPQFLPIVFELAHDKLGADRFLETLRTRLYQNARSPMRDARFGRSRETLAVLARLIVQEFRRQEGRRIDAIVTLNADDFLEQAVKICAARSSRHLDERIIRSVARATHAGLGGGRRRPIPIYHIHGFLPSNIPSSDPKIRRETFYWDVYHHMLVFTDSQYWSTSATAFTFANRVILSVLSDSRCVFVGLSMTDINMLRWRWITT